MLGVAIGIDPAETGQRKVPAGGRPLAKSNFGRGSDGELVLQHRGTPGPRLRRVSDVASPAPAGTRRANLRRRDAGGHVPARGVGPAGPTGIGIFFVFWWLFLFRLFCFECSSAKEVCKHCGHNFRSSDRLLSAVLSARLVARPAAELPSDIFGADVHHNRDFLDIPFDTFS